MKKLFLLILLTACGKSGGSAAGAAAQTDPPPVDTSCAVYDACTYNSDGWGNHTPAYNCTSHTYQKSDLGDVDPSYFEGHQCLTTKEDFHQVWTTCNFGGGPFPCQENVQGPGPLAIPELGL